MTHSGSLELAWDRCSLDASGGGTKGVALPGFTSQPQNAMAAAYWLSPQQIHLSVGRNGSEGRWSGGGGGRRRRRRRRPAGMRGAAFGTLHGFRSLC